MKFRLKTYFIYTVVVLSFICLVNVWMTMAVKNYIANTVDEPMETKYGQLTFADVNVNKGVTGSHITRSIIGERVISKEVNNIPPFSVNDVANLTKDGLHSRYGNEFDSVNIQKTTNTDSYPQPIDTSRTHSYVSDINQTAAERTEIQKHFVDTNVNISEIIEIGVNISELSHATIDSNENISNTTSNAIDDKFDISDKDDHVYLIENPEFKRILESDSDKTFTPERRWKYRHKSNSSYADRKQIYNMYRRKIVNQGGVKCDKLIEKDNDTISIANNIMLNFPRKGIRTEKYVYMKDCDTFKRGRGYIEHPLSDSERDFPLAFGIVMYRDVEQTERLLRAIYRPHNYYCIHVDSKSDKLIRLAVESIVRCLHNVFIASKVENVTWGEFTVLQADLNCMQELWQYESWKYYINLTGQEFPLKTNREIVKILEAMDGANIVDGTWVRASEKYFYRWTSAGNRPPHGIRPIKGSVHVLVNRQFVDFSLHDKRALEFLAWLRKTQIPDETYFASLNHNPHLGIKGSFLGETEEYPLKPAFMRYKNWEFGHSTFSRHCSGKYVRHICILGVGDLHSAYNNIALFVNKFHLDFEYLALDCLEEVLHRKTWQQYLDDADIDVSYYKHLDYVKYKLS